MEKQTLGSVFLLIFEEFGEIENIRNAILENTFSTI